MRATGVEPFARAARCSPRQQLGAAFAAGGAVALQAVHDHGLLQEGADGHTGVERGPRVLEDHLHGAAEGRQPAPAQLRDIRAVRHDPALVRIGRVPHGAGKPSEPHPVGTLEHLYVISGRVRVGPADGPVELSAGDFVRYPGDRLGRSMRIASMPAPRAIAA
jgi:mannose-6-phosphate isomerase-like protein (cupin superfamily)